MRWDPVRLHEILAAAPTEVKCESSEVAASLQRALYNRLRRRDYGEVEIGRAEAVVSVRVKTPDIVEVNLVR